MSYKDRLATYERVKKQIALTAKTPKEYEQRIRALADKLKI